MEPLILGIDSGGSKTIAWLARWGEAAEPEVLGRGTAGPANPLSVGFAEAGKNLGAAVTSAFAAAGIPRQTVASAVLAAAGSDREENRRGLLLWGEETSLAARFQVVHDAWPVLAAGTPHGWGIAVISGTGSWPLAGPRRAVPPGPAVGAFSLATRAAATPWPWPVCGRRPRRPMVVRAPTGFSTRSSTIFISTARRR